MLVWRWRTLIGNDLENFDKSFDNKILWVYQNKAEHNDIEEF